MSQDFHKIFKCDCPGITAGACAGDPPPDLPPEGAGPGVIRERDCRRTRADNGGAPPLSLLPPSGGGGWALPGNSRMSGTGKISVRAAAAPPAEGVLMAGTAAFQTPGTPAGRRGRMASTMTGGCYLQAFKEVGAWRLPRVIEPVGRPGHERRQLEAHLLHRGERLEGRSNNSNTRTEGGPPRQAFRASVAPAAPTAAPLRSHSSDPASVRKRRRASCRAGFAASRSSSIASRSRSNWR